jgi:hypothetical protein
MVRGLIGHERRVDATQDNPETATMEMRVQVRRDEGHESGQREWRLAQ